MSRPPKNECGECNLCCKLPQLNDTDGKLLKKSYEWCKECGIGTGCKIYETRPDNCRGFTCLYREGALNISPHKVGFFVFPEREQSGPHQILTLYCETHKLSQLKQNINKEPNLIKLLDAGWQIIVRYNADDTQKALISLKTKS